MGLFIGQPTEPPEVQIDTKCCAEGVHRNANELSYRWVPVSAGGSLTHRSSTSLMVRRASPWTKVGREELLKSLTRCFFLSWPFVAAQHSVWTPCSLIGPTTANVLCCWTFCYPNKFCLQESDFISQFITQ